MLYLSLLCEHLRAHFALENKKDLAAIKAFSLTDPHTTLLQVNVATVHTSVIHRAWLPCH